MAMLCNAVYSSRTHSLAVSSSFGTISADTHYVTQSLQGVAIRFPESLFHTLTSLSHVESTFPHELASCTAAHRPQALTAPSRAVQTIVVDRQTSPLLAQCVFPSPPSSLASRGCRWVPRLAKTITTTPRIPRWSPTLVLTRRYTC